MGRRSLLPLLPLVLLAGCARQEPRPNVLLIVVDTLRADHLSCYGYARETTPQLDALAARGVRFTRVQAPRAKTTPSVASIMTGLYPHDHGVRDLTTPLAAGVPTLAERLAAKGWDTAAIVGNYALVRELSGLDRGFELWIEDLPQRQGVPPDDVPQRTASSLTDAALEVLGVAPGAVPRWRSAQRPWFLYLHYMDPHGLYDPPPEHRVFEVGLAPRALTSSSADQSRFEQRIATYNLPPDAWLPSGDVDAARVIARYDGEVRFADAEIGRLLAELRAAGELANTWIVVAADHGESLGEHAYWFEHGLYAYQATCHVPLILVPPEGRESSRDVPRGTRAGAVSLADLGPTILDLAGVRGGLGRGREVAGRSRAALLGRDDHGGHAVFSEKVDRSERSRAVQSKAVRLDDWKLIVRYGLRIPEGRRGELEAYVLSEELYDLATDPREERDLASEPPEGAPVDRLRSELARFTAADEELPGLAQELQRRRDELSRESPEALRRLEALGY